MNSNVFAVRPHCYENKSLPIIFNCLACFLHFRLEIRLRDWNKCRKIEINAPLSCRFGDAHSSGRCIYVKIGVDSVLFSFVYFFCRILFVGGWKRATDDTAHKIQVGEKNRLFCSANYITNNKRMSHPRSFRGRQRLRRRWRNTDRGMSADK